jgi:Zn-dependent protease with chaperone function
VNAGSFAADYFDGMSSVRRRVQARREGDRLRIEGDGVALDLATSEVKVHPRIGRTPLRIALPGNGLLVASAEDVAAVLEIPPERGLAHRLESHIGVVVVAIAGVAAASWLGVRVGIPWVAQKIAFHIPPALERDIAEEGLKQMDGFALKPSALAPERQVQLRALFGQLRDRAGGSAAAARLEFRDGGWIGANAFALPGGVVVMTDQLVGLMGNDERIAAVLAHELGHLDRRHGSRQILQSSVAGLLMAALAGDASTLSSVVVGGSSMLIFTGYSRDFEREADRFAYGLLRATQRSPRLLGEALARLEGARAKKGSQECTPDDAPRKKEEAVEPGYLSTHPATAERIRDAEEAAR